MKRFVNKVDVIVAKAVLMMIASDYLYQESYTWCEIGPWVVVIGFVLSIIVDIIGWLRANFTRRKKED